MADALQTPAPVHYRRNDTLPVLRVDVLDEFGDPLALDDPSAPSDVFFTMVAEDSSIKVDRQAAQLVAGIDGSTLNRLEYAWQVGDTDTSGRFRGEFELEYGGPKRTVPAAKRQRIVIMIADDFDAV